MDIAVKSHAHAHFLSLSSLSLSLSLFLSLSHYLEAAIFSLSSRSPRDLQFHVTVNHSKANPCIRELCAGGMKAHGSTTAAAA